MTGSKGKVLIIEDDPPIRKFVRSALIGEGFQPIEAETGREGINSVMHHKPDIIILDLGLPDMDGNAVIRELRGWTSIPVVVLTARGQEKDKVTALDAGADDYLTKPFNVAELMARIRVALRHANRGSSGEAETQQFIVGELKIDFEARRIFRGSLEIHLTNIEYKLLCTLAKNAGKVLTHSFIIHEVWGKHYIDEKHPLRVYMGALRKKIEPEPARPRYILTEMGVGYRIVEE